MSELAKLYQSLVILDEDLAHTAVLCGCDVAMERVDERCQVRCVHKETAEPLKYDERQGCWYIESLVIGEQMASSMIGSRASKWLLDRWDKLTKDELNGGCHGDTLAKLRAVESAMRRLKNK